MTDTLTDGYMDGWKGLGEYRGLTVSCGREGVGLGIRVTGTWHEGTYVVRMGFLEQEEDFVW